ncbi:hypothetical protein [Flavipsychrobacter stenotrophus]|nr:hypothetical protein [Flavipsychrobacter stenotrophus]
MNAGKCLLLLVALMTGYTSVMAQTERYPAKWRYNLKRNTTGETDLIFHLELERGWHVRILDKGDTIFRSPEFSFTRNEELKLVGDMQQEGIREKVTIDSVKYDVYSYKVLYKQQIEAKPDTKISGWYTYQVCNSEKCLAIKKEKFAFIMK